MLKALLKKQLLEMGSFLFLNRKTGKRRTGKSLVGSIVLYAVLFLYLMVAFGVISASMCKPMVDAGLGWLYYSLMSLIALVLGIFGSVFTASSMLYRAKDNDLLLAMPIPPQKILLARMVSVFTWGGFYTALVLLPAILIWALCGGGWQGVVGGLVLLVLLSAVELVFSCLLGGVVASISGRARNKTLTTVVATVGGLALYYFVYFRLMENLESTVLDPTALGGKMQRVAPAYLLGAAGAGSLPAIGILLLVSAALVGLVWMALSRSFLRIALTAPKEKKAEFTTEQIRTSDLSHTLLRKEFKRLTGSAIYLLNGCFGVLIMVAAAVALFIKAGAARGAMIELGGVAPGVVKVLPLLMTMGVCLVAGMDAVTACSISMEGKSLWLLQSMPIRPMAVFYAKERVSEIINVPPAVLLTASMAWVLGVDLSTALYMVLVAVVYVYFIAALGLVVNLLMPNLNWTSETVCVKQSGSVAVVMFGGWLICAVLGGAGWLLSRVVETDTVLLVLLLVLCVATRMLNGWLNTKGSQIFAEL